MKYEPTSPISRDELAEVLASDDPDRITRALIGLAFHDTDWEFVQKTCFEQSTNRHVWVRRVSATCLAHVARIHGKLDRESASKILDRLASDPETASFARDATEEIDWWLAHPAKR